MQPVLDHIARYQPGHGYLNVEVRGATPRPRKRIDHDYSSARLEQPFRRGKSSKPCTDHQNTHFGGSVRERNGCSTARPLESATRFTRLMALNPRSQGSLAGVIGNCDDFSGISGKMTTAKYDLNGAASVFAAAHHKRMRDAYAKEQVAAAETLCLSVLEAAASRGFSIKPENNAHSWHVSASNSAGDAYVCISEQGDIQVSTRKLESPHPLKIRYDTVEKTFVSTHDTETCVATTLANAIVAALDEGWDRATRTGRISQP
jgi:hypothetical protein